MFGFTWSDGTAPRFRLTTIRSRPERRLPRRHAPRAASRRRQGGGRQMLTRRSFFILGGPVALAAALFGPARSEEHTSELQSLMRISYAVFCLKKKQPNQSK